MDWLEEDDEQLEELKPVKKKRKKSTSPTQRSLKYLRDQGYTAVICEYWNYFTKQRHDLFGFFDIIAIHPKDKDIIGIQTTTTSNASARYHKALALPELRTWLIAGGRIWILSWSKKGARGKRKLWQHTIREITLKDFIYDTSGESED